MKVDVMQTQSRRRTKLPCPAGEVDPRSSILDPRSSMLHSRSAILAACATAALLYLGYFPVACGWLGWIALVPLLALVRSPARPRTVYLAAYLAGLLFFWPVLQWMRVADWRMYFTWAMLATYCAVYFPAGVWLLRRLDGATRLPLTVTLPLVWTGLEYVRAHLMTGFPWYFLGHTQHDWLPAIQIADLGGAYAVTFVVAAVNGLVFELLASRGRFRSWFALPAAAPRRPAAAWQAAAVAVLVAATLGYGVYRLGQEDFAAGPRVALVQGNLDQRIRNAASGGADEAARTMVRHYEDLSDLAAERRPDLIVWPETSYPGWWYEMPAGRPDRESRDLAALVARNWRTNVLLGLPAATREDRSAPELRYNSALLVCPDGTTAGRYDKMHRVPFGEFVPLRDWLPFMDRLAPYDFDYSIRAGEQWTHFPLGRYTFGALICYEDTDPYLARQYVAPGGEGAVDFLVNISNDGWFNGTSEHEEHLAVCRFRAVECRRSVVRAVNMGVSAVIDPNGRVLAPQATMHDDVHVWEVEAGASGLPPARWAEFKKTQGVLTAAVPIDRRPSLYAACGDWLPAGCWVALIACYTIGRGFGGPSRTGSATQP
jgi:apolipoprotein N-acyltransferase